MTRQAPHRVLVPARIRVDREDGVGGDGERLSGGTCGEVEVLGCGDRRHASTPRRVRVSQCCYGVGSHNLLP